MAGFIPSILMSLQNHLSILFWFYLESKFEIDLIKKRAGIDMATHEDPAQNDLFNKVSENGI